jgi:hypothetical protein
MLRVNRSRSGMGDFTHTSAQISDFVLQVITPLGLHLRTHAALLWTSIAALGRVLIKARVNVRFQG